ncbi:hypothetical protein DVT68_10665 [Dyella solisilvae]|uniref:Uncharacterized protein n=1 Tax=Dyella solisilvae TaxID=1920168 RepID=A0A370K8I6_9GAMM|nr:hypothetical protein DVT68_10665 [Dyella solisilvae]
MVAELKAAAVDADEDKGVLVLNYKKVLRVRTSSTHLRRALILMNTLIKHFEALGLSVRIGSAYIETELVLKEGAVRFRLDERTKRTEPSHDRSGRTKRSRIESEYLPWQPRYTMVPTGEFTLSFGQYQLSGCRCLWKDKPGQPLESQLHQVLGAVPSWEAALKAQRQERERWERLAREAEERQIAAAHAAEILRLQRARLVNQLTAWERAKRLRRFVEALKLSESRMPEIEAWVSWVTEQAAELDPLCHDLHALSNFHLQLESQFTGHRHLDEPTENWWDESTIASASAGNP